MNYSDNLEQEFGDDKMSYWKTYSKMNSPSLNGLTYGEFDRDEKYCSGVVLWCNQALPKRVKTEREKQDRKVQRKAKRGERPRVCGSVRIPARVGRLVER